MEPTTLLLLVVAAFLAGFIDSQVGGGGVITLPALLAAGLPPHIALGTNKLAATGASSTAAIQYVRAGLVRARDARWLVPLALVGSAIGALTVLQVPAKGLLVLVVGVMGGMTVYVLARPAFGREAHPDRRTAPRGLLVGLLVLGIGFYDGFLGPGTGSFLLFALAATWGMAFLGAAALGRVLNFATNGAALAVFAWQGSVDYVVGATMLIGTVSGGFVGSRIAIRGGQTWIRGLFVTVTVLLMGKLLWDLLT